jgi:hypothetical protein
MQLISILLILNCTILLSTEYRTVPFEVPEGSQAPSDFEEGNITLNRATVYEDGILVQFRKYDRNIKSIFDSLYYYNGSTWITHSFFDWDLDGRVSTYHYDRDGNLYVRASTQTETFRIHRYDNNGNWDKVDIPWDTYEDVENISPFEVDRRVLDLDFDQESNIVVLNDHIAILDDDIKKVEYQASAGGELLVFDKNENIIMYRRTEDPYYEGYNIRDTLPNQFFNSYDQLLVRDNGDILFTALSFRPDSLVYPAAVYSLVDGVIKPINIGFEDDVEVVNRDNPFQCQDIIEVNGRVWILQRRNRNPSTLHSSTDLVNWTSYFSAETDIPIADDVDNDVFGISNISGYNNKLYVGTTEGLLTIDENDNIERIKVFNSEENQYIDNVSDILISETSTWITTPHTWGRQWWYKVEKVSSIDEDIKSNRIATSTQYYDTMGNELSEEDIQSGIPHLKVIRFKDGGFKVEKRVMR